MATRALIAKLSSLSLSPLFSSSRTSAPKSLSLPLCSRPFTLRLRPLLSIADIRQFPVNLAGGGLRCFSTRPTTSSLNDPSPNWSNRPPKETILLDGCDFEHWLVVMEPPDPNLTRDEIIDSYIKTLAQVLGSEEEARKSIYSVSTKHYFAFGCIVSEELSYKIKPLPKVRWVLPDSYLDVKNKDYGGEPFIDGKAVPYDPKYHEEWVRNNARANERSRRNDRPRNFDRSRNFERRRENMQSRDFQNRDGPPPMPNQEFQNRDGPNPVPPPPRGDMPPPMPNRDFQNHQRDFNAMPPMGGPPTRDGPPSPEYSNMPNRGYQNQMPNPQSSYVPNRDGGYQGGGPGYQGGNPGYQGGGPTNQGGGPNYQGGNPGYQGGNPGYQGGGPTNQGGGPGYQGVGPNYQGGNPGYQGGGPTNQGGGPGYQGVGPNYQGGNPGYQGVGPTNQGGVPGNQGGGPNYQGSGPGYQARDLPGRDYQ